MKRLIALTFSGHSLRRGLAVSGLVVFVLCAAGCGVFLDDIGGRGQPCSPKKTCQDKLFCSPVTNTCVSIVSTDGDSDEDTETALSCSVPCAEGNGYFCDTSVGSCRQLVASPCDDIGDCDQSGGEYCLPAGAMNSPAQSCGLCVRVCKATDTSCPIGFSCNLDLGVCMPRASFQGCGATKKSRNNSCIKNGADTCPYDTACTYFTRLTSYPYGWCTKTCSSVADCLQNPDGINEACLTEIGGRCVSICSSTEDCSPGVDCLDINGDGNLYCVHQSIFFRAGSRTYNETCDFDTASCAEGFYCHGGTCRKLCGDAPGAFGGCSGEYGTQCSVYTDVQFGVCMSSGNVEPGGGCRINDLNKNLGDCRFITNAYSQEVFAACLSYTPKTESCSTVDTCQSTYYPSPTGMFCDENYCGCSLCAPVCDSANSCAYLTDLGYGAFESADVGGICYCVAVVMTPEPE